MSFGAGEPTDFLNGVDYSEFTQIGRFSTVTVSTGSIDPNGQEKFRASEEESFVESVDIIPEGIDLPKRARIVSVKVNVKGSSTNSTFRLFQSDQYNEIDQVVEIDGLTVSGTPETYNLGGGIGIPFINKEEENQIYFDIEELSGNSSQYSVEVNWLNLSR
jgi:hypothetical protein